MSRRRRWGIAFGLGCALVVLAVVGFGPDRGQPRVQLIFLGYTNHVVVTFGQGTNTMIFTNPGPFAVFLATNSGSCRIGFGPSPKTFSSSEVLHYFANPPVHSHTVLKPGEATQVFSDFRKNGSPFRTRLDCWTFGRRDGLADWLESSTHLTLRKLGALIRPSTQILEALSEPLTAPVGAGMDLDEVLRLPPRRRPAPSCPPGRALCPHTAAMG